MNTDSVWLKKIDYSLLRYGTTVIPESTRSEKFDLTPIFTSSSKKDPSSHVSIEWGYPGKVQIYSGWVTYTKFEGKWKNRRKPVMRLQIDKDLQQKLSNIVSFDGYKNSLLDEDHFLEITWNSIKRCFTMTTWCANQKSTNDNTEKLKPPIMSSQLDENLSFEPGALFMSRAELGSDGIHKPPQSGIWNAGSDYAVSIVLSGGYVDDYDNGDEILYTGQGGRDEKGRQVQDQELTRGNLGLFNSMKAIKPVRVTRGYQTKLGPEKGYRYDGLYLVKRAFYEPSIDGPFIWRFELSKIIETSEEILWQKVLTKTDAQRQAGNQTGDLRLTKANFFVNGEIIDHKTYFRNVVFGGESWVSTGRGKSEICKIRMHVSVAAGRFEGRTKFEISHRPSGESGQGNYTTGLRWGSWMSHVLMNEIDCTGRTLQIVRLEDEIQIKIL